MALFGTSDKGTDMFSLLARFKEEEIKKVLLFGIQVIHCHIADNAPKLEEAAQSAGREDVVNWKGQRLKLLPPSQLD